MIDKRFVDLWIAAAEDARVAFDEHYSHTLRHGCEDWKTGQQCAEGEALKAAWYELHLYRNALGWLLGIEPRLVGHLGLIYGPNGDAPSARAEAFRPYLGQQWGHA